MTKKHLNSSLFILLLVIWGAVIYKHFGKSPKSHGELLNQPFESVTKNESQSFKDTFKLKITNKNPFKTTKKTRQISSNDSKTVIKKARATKTTVISKETWPKISYHGYVKGDRKSTKLVLLKVDNKLYRKRENETVHDIILMKAYNDSLIIRLNNNTKTIKRNYD